MSRWKNKQLNFNIIYCYMLQKASWILYAWIWTNKYQMHISIYVFFPCVFFIRLKASCKTHVIQLICRVLQSWNQFAGFQLVAWCIGSQGHESCEYIDILIYIHIIKQILCIYVFKFLYRIPKINKDSIYNNTHVYIYIFMYIIFKHMYT